MRGRRVEKGGGQDAQALGRRRGGFGTKVHAAVSGLGRPVAVVLGPGQDADVTHAPARLAGRRPAGVVADKGYDSKALVRLIRGRGAAAVIPTRTNSPAPRAVDPDLYRERNLVERFWAKAEPHRRVATRYEKTAGNHRAFAHVASVMILLQ